MSHAGHAALTGERKDITWVTDELEVKLKGVGQRGQPRLVIRFLSTDGLLRLYREVRDKGAFAVPVETDQPTAVEVSVLFRTQRRGEEFPASILAWQRGVAVLRPNISLPDFKELSGSLLVSLSSESGSAETIRDTALALGSDAHEVVKPVARPLTGEFVALPDEPKPIATARRMVTPSPAPVGEPVRRPALDTPKPTRHAHLQGRAGATERTDTSSERVAAPSAPAQAAALRGLSAGQRAAAEARAAAAEMRQRPTTGVQSFAPQPSKVDHRPPSKVSGDVPVVPEPPVPTTSPAAVPVDPVVTTGVYPARPEESEPSPVARTREYPRVPSAVGSTTETSGSREAVPPEPRLVSGAAEAIGFNHTGTSVSKLFPAPALGPAYGFLQHLELGQPVAQGAGSGREALVIADQCDTAVGQWALTAESLSDERRWVLIYQEGRALTAYLLPATGLASLPIFLLRQGLFTEAVTRQVLAAAGESDVPVERAILELGVLDPELLAKAMAAQVKLIRKLLTGEQAVSYTLRPLRKALPLPGAAASEADAFKRRLAELAQSSWETMGAAEEPFLSAYPTYTGTRQYLTQALKLDGRSEHFVVNCLNGRHTLRDIPKLTSLGRAEWYALIFGLREHGLLNLVTPETPAGNRRLTRKIAEHFERIGHVNDFEFLGLHWTAVADEVDHAVARLERAFAPPAVAALDATTKSQAAAICAEATRIRARLDTLEQRRAYRLAILEPFAVDQAVELLLSNLDMALYRDDGPEIERILERIRDLDPNAALAARTRVNARRKS